MNKKAVIFFLLFALLMIGGSLVLSLWFLPGYLIPYYPLDDPDSTAGMIRPQSIKDSASTDPLPRNEKNLGLIIAQLLIGVGAICIVAHLDICKELV